jgi:dolichyl-phosphate-mannose--protein O-mannosyl transferase
MIHLKHVVTRKFLKSFPKAYCHPGTSGQQMVVASLEKTEETRWLVKGQHRLGNSYPIGEDVVHGSMVRLEHYSTTRNLHSHGDRRSPVTGQQEVTCIGTNGVCDENDDWIVEIQGGGAWSFDKQVKLIHVNTKFPLHSHNNQSHPIFTNGEQEVTCFPNPAGDDNDFWIVTSPDQPLLGE